MARDRNPRGPIGERGLTVYQGAVLNRCGGGRCLAATLDATSVDGKRYWLRRFCEATAGGPAKHEKDQREHNADHDDLPLRNRASRAHARGHPHAGRRGKPVHVMAFLASDDNARPEKPDARHDALDHAALFRAGRRVDRQNGLGSARQSFDL